MKTDASQSAVQRQANDGLRASLGRVLLALALGTLLAACASTLPGAGYPRTPSLALPHPEETALGRQLENLPDHREVIFI